MIETKPRRREKTKKIEKSKIQKLNLSESEMDHLRIAICLLLIGFVHNSVIRNGNEPAQSLYDDRDQVVVLTNANFYQMVYDQPYASNVEFYNSFCGFCRNFAPIYKQFAEDVAGWRDTLRVSAIDCADDANNDICRDMEIMRYPTLRYFPPFYRNETNHLGIEIQHPPHQVGESYLLELMANCTNVPDGWPNLHPIDATTSDALFDSLPMNIEYIFLVHEQGNNQSILAQKIAIDLRRFSNVQIRRIVSTAVTTNLGLGDQSAVYVGTRSNRSIEKLPQTPSTFNRSTVRTSIEQYLSSKGYRIAQSDEQQLPIPEKVQPSEASKIPTPDETIGEQDLAIIEHVKANPDVVYQADLETAIRYSIFHELVKYNKMNDEQIAALRRYVSILFK